MKQIATNTSQEEYLRILGKGMVTIPKVWREELGLEEGKMVRAQKIGNRMVIEKIKVYSMGKAKDNLRRVRIYDNI